VKETKYTCDNCAKTFQCDEDYMPSGWLEVTIPVTSPDTNETAIYKHFCSEECLRNQFPDVKTKTQTMILEEFHAMQY
jgi:hypothetical protein